MLKNMLTGCCILLLLVVSCKKTQEKTIQLKDIEKQQNQKIIKQDLKKIEYIDYILDEKTEVAIKDWQEYAQIQEVITSLKEANLVFFDDADEVVKTLIKNLQATIPSEINSQSVLARILVLETKLFKLHSLYNLATTTNQELVSVIKDVLIAFSNLNLQMNKKVEFDSRIIEKP